MRIYRVGGQVVCPECILQEVRYGEYWMSDAVILRVGSVGDSATPHIWRTHTENPQANKVLTTHKINTTFKLALKCN